MGEARIAIFRRWLADQIGIDHRAIAAIAIEYAARRRQLPASLGAALLHLLAILLHPLVARLAVLLAAIATAEHTAIVAIIALDLDLPAFDLLLGLLLLDLLDLRLAYRLHLLNLRLAFALLHLALRLTLDLDLLALLVLLRALGPRGPLLARRALLVIGLVRLLTSAFILRRGHCRNGASGEQ